MNDDSVVPLISVALCTYNGALYLQEQLESILAQTHRNIEVVAVDDGSTDNTLALLNEYAARDRRIRVLRNSVNLGFKANFSRAFAECRGDFIAPSDQDDIWRPEKLSALLHAIGDFPMTYCDAEFVDARGQPFGVSVSEKVCLQDIDDPAKLIFENCVSGHAVLFRRSLLAQVLPIPDGFDYHDWWLAVVAAANGGVRFCPEKLVLYRLHAGNLTDMVKLRAESLKKKSGYKLAVLREVGRRLEALARFQSAHREFLAKFSNLWKAREEQWLSISLAWFAMQHRTRLYSVPKLSPSRALRKAFSLALGIKAKRLADRRAYSR